jgi:hypothetical protein
LVKLKTLEIQSESMIQMESHGLLTRILLLRPMAMIPWVNIQV